MEAEGFFKLKGKGPTYDPAQEPTYLWVPEMEWLRPKEILAYTWEEYHKLGFVPFASVGKCPRPGVGTEAVSPGTSPYNPLRLIYRPKPIRVGNQLRELAGHRHAQHFSCSFKARPT